MLPAKNSVIHIHQTPSGLRPLWISVSTRHSPLGRTWHARMSFLSPPGSVTNDTDVQLRSTCCRGPQGSRRRCPEGFHFSARPSLAGQHRQPVRCVECRNVLFLCFWQPLKVCSRRLGAAADIHVADGCRSCCISTVGVQLTWHLHFKLRSAQIADLAIGLRHSCSNFICRGFMVQLLLFHLGCVLWGQADTCTSYVPH